MNDRVIGKNLSSQELRNETAPSPELFKIPVDVKAETLQHLGFSSIEACESISPDELYALLKEATSDKNSHSWKWFAFDNYDKLELPDAVRRCENKKRPTILFYYYGNRKGGERVLIAVGSISSRVNRLFPFAGFPVIARCYILDAYRNFRLYQHLLVHRARACRMAFGETIDGIHMGSNNPRIFNAIKDRKLGMQFIYLGSELLDAESKTIVRAFLFPSDQFKQSLVHAVSAPGLSEAQTLVQKLLNNEADPTTFYHLQRAVRKIETARGCALNSLPVQKLLTLMSAVPIQEIENKDEPHS